MNCSIESRNLTKFTCFTEFSTDIVVSVLNQSEMQTVVSFAGTSKSNRVLVSEVINFQFNQLLQYTNENCKTYAEPSIEKRIRDKWINIQSIMISSELKVLISSELKTCINFKVFKEAFDVLKLFSHQIHFKKDEVFSLNCPIFITEMLSPDSAENIRNDVGSFVFRLIHGIPPLSSINSVAKELEKIGLLIEGEAEKQPLMLLDGHIAASFYLRRTDKINSLYFSIFEGTEITTVPCMIEAIKDKWDNINGFYSKSFINFDFKGKKINPIPLRKYLIEREKKYFEIYSYAEKQIYDRALSDKDIEALSYGEYWLRYSESQKDDFGNPKIVFCIKKLARIFKYLIPIETFSSTKEFDAWVQGDIK